MRRMMQSVAAIARKKAIEAAAPFDPLDLSPAIWLDASDSSTLFDATSGGSLPADTAAVKRIEDKSGNGRHFTEATTAPTRAVAAVNGLGALLFSASAEFLTRTGGTFSTATFQNIFVVSKTSDTAYALLTESAGGSFIDATQSSGSGAASGVTVGQFRVNGADVGGLRSDLLTARGTNQNLLSAMDLTSFANATLADLQLNYTAGGGFNMEGHLCELLIIPGTMTTGDRDDLEAYLIAKWAI